MTDVYLSYARPDRTQAARLAQALEAQGFSVWWDAEELPGDRYAEEAPKRRSGAQALLALWSQESVQRTWVLDEAAAARDALKLVNVSLDGSLAPAGFAQLQLFDLGAWTGDSANPAFVRLSGLLARLRAGDADPTVLPSAVASLPARSGGGRWRLALGFTAFVAALAAAAAIYTSNRPAAVAPELDGDTTPPGMAQAYGLEAEDLSGFGAHDLVRLALARSGLERIEAGAEDGDALGLGLSCVAHALGEGAPEDASLARTRCEAAAAAGSSLGPLMLARLAEAGQAGLSPDQAAGFLDQAGAADDPRALTEQARRALQSTPPDAASALPLAQRGAQMGHHPAELLLGWMFETGAAGEVDLAQAYTWYDAAAQKAYPPALTASARLLEEGRGVTIDEQGARSRYEEAASRGDAEAAFHLALMLQQGRGGPQDRERALTLLRTAAAADHPGAAAALTAIEPIQP